MSDLALEVEKLRRRLRLQMLILFGTVVVGAAALGGADAVARTTASALVAGGVLFEGVGGATTQDSANFFWDDTNNRLGLGTAAPSSRLDVNGTTRFRSTMNFGSSGQEANIRWSSNVGNGEPGTFFQSKAGRAAVLGSNGNIAGVTVSATGDVVVNEGGLAADFRVESDLDARALFVNGLNGFFGVGTDTPTQKLDVAGGLALRAVNPPVITGFTSDYPLGDGSFFRLNATGSFALNGIAGGTDGRVVILTNVGIWNISLMTNDSITTSLPQNRIIVGADGSFPPPSDVRIRPNNSAILVYDGATQRWRVVIHRP